MDKTTQICIQISPVTFYALNVLLLGNGPNLPEFRTIEDLLAQIAKTWAHGTLYPNSPEAEKLHLMGYTE